MASCKWENDINLAELLQVIYFLKKELVPFYFQQKFKIY